MSVSSAEILPALAGVGDSRARVEATANSPNPKRMQVIASTTFLRTNVPCRMLDIVSPLRSF
jgi:hypothetical protein